MFDSHMLKILDCIKESRGDISFRVRQAAGGMPRANIRIDGETATIADRDLTRDEFELIWDRLGVRFLQRARVCDTEDISCPDRNISGSSSIPPNVTGGGGITASGAVG